MELSKQKAIEFFQSHGYKVTTLSGSPELVAERDGRTVYIEAKGQSERLVIGSQDVAPAVPSFF